MFAGGCFQDEQTGTVLNGLARWNGFEWSAVGTFLSLGIVRSMAIFDDGGGPQLYVAGVISSFERDGQVVLTNNICRRSPSGPSNWSTVGGGIRSFVDSSPPVNGEVRAMAVFDDGAGAALYVGGAFNFAGGSPASNIARWDGQGWSAVGGGTDSEVRALVVFDDGSGPALYAGGTFRVAGGITANGIARWNGSEWSALDGGVTNDSGIGSSVFALAVFDDGDGSALYAGGNFRRAGGVAADRIAKWNGRSWSPLGQGITPINSSVNALAAVDVGDGPFLYAGGSWSGAPSPNLRRWDGVAWSGVGGGIVHALAPLTGDQGTSLFVGGWFSGGVRRWGCPEP
jgi:hypothetical protein